METEANLLEFDQAEKESNLKKYRKARKELKVAVKEKHEIRFGIRALMTSPLPACEKLDKIFGSGGEAIVHHMWFESGHSLFGNMIECNPGKSMEELLKALVESQPRAGWGDISAKIIHRNPPMVDILVKNPPVKTVKGSRKYLIGSFWAGVLSRYFARQLICKDFDYNTKTDEFACTITI